MRTPSLFVAFRVLPLAFLLASCAMPPPRAGGSLRTAGQHEVVDLNPHVRALVSPDTSFSASHDFERPSILLREGKLVVQKQKDGGICEIITGPARTRLVGTTVLAEKRGGILRLISVEGRARVNWGNRAGEYRMLNTGEMLMVDESRQTLPNPVVANLGQLLSREELLAPGFLSSDKLALIEDAARAQAERIAAGRLQVLSPALGTAGGIEPLLNGDVGRTTRAVTTQVNVLSSQTLGSVGGVAGGVTQAVSQTLGGLLGNLGL